MSSMTGSTTGNMEIEEFSRLARAIESEVSRMIVGQQEIVRSVIIGVIAGRHVLLEGVPGLGKTQLIRTLADVLDLHFSRIQFTPDLMPSDVTGTNVMEETEEGRRTFRFQAGPIFANLVLADEVNRATPKTQSALLEAMQEKTVTVAGKNYKLESPFFVLATQNPLEMEGTYPLPEAQLDRFILKVNVNFPTVSDLVTIIDRTTGSDVPTVGKVADGAQIVQMGRLALNTPVPTHLSEYVARLIVASHPESDSAPKIIKDFVRYGASPRGAQALIIGAKVNALLEGRFNVSFEDVNAVAASALRHRLLLNFEGMAEGIHPDVLVEDIIKATQRVAV